MAGIYHVLQQLYYGQLDSPTTIQLQFVIQSKGDKCISKIVWSGLSFCLSWRVQVLLLKETMVDIAGLQT